MIVCPHCQREIPEILTYELGDYVIVGKDYGFILTVYVGTHEYNVLFPYYPSSYIQKIHAKDIKLLGRTKGFRSVEL